MDPRPSTSAMELREELADHKKAAKDCIIAGLQEMYFSETLCDVTIVTADKRFLGHRVVLASVSPYFKALFTCTRKESALGEVCLLDIPSSVMATILHYIYTGEAHLTLMNVEKLLIVSSRLQVTAMKDMCSSYLAKRVDDENSLWIYRLAHSHNHTSLLDAAINHIGVNVCSLTGKDNFLHLEMEELINCLSSDNLMVSSELAVYNLARCWWEFRTKEDNPLPMDLLKVIRLPLLNPDELEKVSRDISRHDHDPCFNLPTGITLRQGMFEERIVCMEVKALYETNPEEEDYYMTTYDPETDSWEKLPFCGNLQQAGFASVGCCLYVSGGFRHDCCGFRQDCCASNALYMYDAVLNEWKELPSMTHPRGAHGFLAYRNMLYAVAGRNKNGLTNSVECFSVLDNSWRNLSNMRFALYSFTTTVRKERLYVFGGFTMTEIDMTHNQGFHSYNILEDTWMYFSICLFYSVVGAVTLDDKIYVLGDPEIRRGYYAPSSTYTVLRDFLNPGKVYESFCMDHIGRIWFQIPPVPKNTFGAAVVRWKHRIYIVGGSGNRHHHMFYWSPGEPSWTYMQELPFQFDYFRCVTLQVPLKHLLPIIPGRRSNYNFRSESKQRNEHEEELMYRRL